MNRFYFNKSNRAALFFAMTLLPSGIAYSQVKKDTVAKENKIDEVVVIGYGTQRKEAVTGSVATVKEMLCAKCLLPTLPRHCREERQG